MAFRPFGLKRLDSKLSFEVYFPKGLLKLKKIAIVKFLSNCSIFIEWQLYKTNLKVR